ncbi:PBSX family phage terminase large subunit [Thermoactinomyces sp. DSM 45892]|uniref:PBSX family phage terminase large subunit n=1 Tax=Thermoactinomyces sp. DSM 45892 TaxID=1882753 RepID=UPI00089C6F23|nr:PBSX family phage terminase large subunit [Thermoactinomyces sp. DSM 45892]SDZ00616.1 phage terminase, large subunit, PBSX family [Thermoactinomyces sp. DSM 45892]
MSKGFQFKPFSRKQKQLLMWWMPESPYAGFDGVIAEGSIRAGKTISMIDSFLMWSLTTFENQTFIIGGRSIGALNRNVVKPLFDILTAKGIKYKYVRSGEDRHIRIGSNIYYLFGGSNEKSQDTVQGLTAAGIYLDEVALMPRSFVDQCVGRCSVHGAKFFFNCNPKGPRHWFKTDFIDQAKERKFVRLHFLLEDNLSLDESVISRLKRQFSGVFYRRNILGEWVTAEGVIYSMFDEERHVVEQPPTNIVKTWIGVDYGNSNATTFMLCGLDSMGRFHVLDEYYHSGRDGLKKSPSQYVEEFQKFYSRHSWPIEYILIDPSAQAFTLQLYSELPPTERRKIAPSKNDVIPGIETVASLIESDRFSVQSRCKHFLEEIHAYTWDEKAQERGEDRPTKQHDHTLDAVRYCAYTLKHLWMRR